MFSIPIMVYRKLPYILMVLIDGCAVLFYLALVAWVNHGMDWYVQIAVPVILLGTVPCGSSAICLSTCQQIYFVYGDGCCDRDGSVLCGY